MLYDYRILVVLAAVVIAGCRGGGYPVGIIYNSTEVPHEMDRAEIAGQARGGDKTGEACATGVLGLVAWGDASLYAAKKAGDITEVHSVEFRPTAVLFGAYYQACTTAHGK
jgi:hypothetical protein